MSAYPTTHVRTREATVQEVRDFITKELNEISRALERTDGVNYTVPIELIAERNALARVLKFLSSRSEVAP